MCVLLRKNGGGICFYKIFKTFLVKHKRPDRQIIYPAGQQMYIEPSQKVLREICLIGQWTLTMYVVTFMQVNAHLIQVD